MKRFIRFAFLSILAIFSISSAYANSGGITARTSLGCGDASCHGGVKNAATSIVIPMPTGGFNIEPGGTLELRIQVGHSLKFAAGFNVKVTEETTSKNAGTLVAGNGSRIQFNELTHNSPRETPEGIAEWAFSWKAPSTPGTYLIRAAANAVNGDGGASTADSWNIMEPIAINVGTSSLDEDIVKSSIVTIPNPTTGDMRIDFNLPYSTDVQMSISAVDGSIIWQTNTEQREAGTNTILWDGLNMEGIPVASGQYIAIIRYEHSFIHVPIIVNK